MAMTDEAWARIARANLKYQDGQLFWAIGGQRRTMFKPLGVPIQGGLQLTLYGKRMFVHSWVWLMHYDEIVRGIRHKDGDVTNNRIENLELGDHPRWRKHEPA